MQTYAGQPSTGLLPCKGKVESGPESSQRIKVSAVIHSSHVPFWPDSLSSTSPDSWLLDFSLTVQLRSLVSLYVCSQSTYPTLAYSYSLVETLEPVARVWNPSSAHSLAVQFWANYSTCMCLSFLAIKQDNERTWLIWSWWRLNELRYLKGYERCLAHPKCYPNVYEHYGYCYYYLALYMLFNFLSCYSALL